MVRLREHRLRGLRQDIVLRVLGHGQRHIGVPDRAFRSGDILRRRGQVRRGVFEAVLYRADGGLLIQRLLDGSVQYIDGRVGVLLVADVQCRAVAALETEGLRPHIGQADLDGLVCLRAGLKDNRIILGTRVFGADRFRPGVELRVGGLVDIALRVADADGKARDLSGKSRSGEGMYR